MSPMAEMSQGIRMVLERHGQSLTDLPDKTLVEFYTIVAAFRADLKAEMERREKIGVEE